jgi:hypothetical protein
MLYIVRTIGFLYDQKENLMAVHGTIDLETLDVIPQATVLSLGAVKFNPFSDEEPHSELYLKILIEDQDRLGRTASDATIKWWSEQDPAIMEEAFEQTGAVTVEEALRQLNKWCVGVDEFWGQGYGFDFTMLEDMYRSIGKPVPWQFWQISDSRTITKRMPRDPRKDMQTNLHNALADAYFQAKSIQIMFKHNNWTK